MFKTASTLESKGYSVIYAVNSKGKVTKTPKTFVCPDCLEAAAKFTVKEVLQRKAAQHVVIGEQGHIKLALCSKCGWTKTNLPKKASPAPKKTAAKKATKKPATKKAAPKKAVKNQAAMRF